MPQHNTEIIKTRANRAHSNFHSNIQQILVICAEVCILDVCKLSLKNTAAVQRVKMYHSHIYLLASHIIQSCSWNAEHVLPFPFVIVGIGQPRAHTYNCHYGLQAIHLSHQLTFTILLSPVAL